ncbi:MAG: (Fe-S)-binding protein [Thiogranum sp.]
MNDLSATQRCVKCGLCLPHCPTFQLTGNEADSPRGRISLMQMLDQPESDWSPGLFRHLDQCLLCHACEAMCPSNVPYDALMDLARERLETGRHRSLAQRLVRAAGLGLLTSGSGRRITAVVLGVMRAVGVRRLVRLPGMPERARRLLKLIPAPVPRGRPPEDVAGSARLGQINLFTGCTGKLFDRTTLRSTRHLLGRLGYRVITPDGQGCCGALHQHNGEPRKAGQLAAANRAAFGTNADPIVTCASGCCAQLRNYTGLYPEADAFSQRVTDIMAFIAEHHAGALRLKPLQAKVALHLPCTQRNVLGQEALLRVLGWIPGLELMIVNPEGGCCGAAGSYMLAQPELADRLGAAMVERVLATDARILLTTNIGCSLQLAAGIRQQVHELEVMHPVTLLDALLE